MISPYEQKSEGEHNSNLKKHYQLHEYTIAQKQLQSLEFHKKLYREVAEK